MQPHELNPAKVFDTLNAHQRSSALRGAIELGVFTAIAEGARTVDAIADRCEASRRGIRILCDFLVVDEWLQKENATYSLSPTAAEFLVRTSPRYLGGIANFINSDHLLDAFLRPAELVRQGTTLLSQEGTVESDYSGWVEFARCMVPMMMPAAHFLAQQAAEHFRGPTQVLDIAAGHGMFGITIAQQLPEAKVTAQDWPAVLEVAQQNAAAAGISDGYRLLAGDAFQVEFGERYDLVLVTNFFHHFSPDACVQVMQKIRASLKPEGSVYTLEFVPDENRVSPPAAATFAFTMLGTTPEGDAYTFAEYEAMFHQAGFAHSRVCDVPNSVQRLIISD